MATIKDVARLAKVSTATVSNVLTGKKLVSDELKGRVADAMKALNYTPNTIARRLKTNKNYVIGVVVPDIVNPFFAEVYKNIEFEATKKGYQIVLWNTAEDPEREKSILGKLSVGNVDAIIDVTSRLDNKDLKDGFSVPFVSVDRSIKDPGKNVAVVHSDNYKAGQIAANYLADEGYEKFMCVAGPAGNTSSAKHRLEGFIDALSERGYDAESIEKHICRFNFTDGYRIMDEYLDRLEKGVRTAVFACNDMLAWGVIEACQNKGYGIPGDIGVIGNDNIWCSSYISGGMTTIENSAEGLGKKAVELVFEALENDGTFTEQDVILQPKLCKRNTV